MIVREKEPLNLEMPFGSLQSFITPTDRFYVRSHFPLPHMDLRKWRLKVTGRVGKPLSLTLRQLRAMPARTVTVTMECAGNSRVFLEPQREGAQWEAGAVGNAEWTGVPLAAVLERADILPSALEVILEGADQGQPKFAPRPSGKIHYSRSLPASKALDDVLLAYEMNGADLTTAHGFPLRAVVPGWYGMAAVKWLTTINVTDAPYHGYFQSIDYSYWERGSHAPTLVPITTGRVKALIARPETAEVIPAGRPCRIHGAAWTSDAEISRVEVSTDGGRRWQEATLLGKSIRNAWRLWEYHWRVPAKPGAAVLMARATDSENRTQPAQHHEDRGPYLIHHWLPVEVIIR
jgi:DMSO/TMAO reductase YedYZ molybdopterin-dependent catalytic subunit